MILLLVPLSCVIKHVADLGRLCFRWCPPGAKLFLHAAKALRGNLELIPVTVPKGGIFEVLGIAKGPEPYHEIYKVLGATVDGVHWLRPVIHS